MRAVDVLNVIFRKMSREDNFFRRVDPVNKQVTKSKTVLYRCLKDISQTITGGYGHP